MVGVSHHLKGLSHFIQANQGRALLFNPHHDNLFQLDAMTHLLSRDSALTLNMALISQASLQSLPQGFTQASLGLSPTVLALGLMVPAPEDLTSPALL